MIAYRHFMKYMYLHSVSGNEWLYLTPEESDFGFVAEVV